MVINSKAEKEINWNPLGCGEHNKESGPHFPVELLPRLRELELDIETLYNSWELIRFAGGEYNGISEKEETTQKQKALIIIILALRLSAYEGSTRLSFTDDIMKRIKEDFNLDEPEFVPVEKLFNEIRQAVTGDNLLAGLNRLFGRPGEYRPLIIDENCLYMQKLHVLENRVAEKLRERLNLSATNLIGITGDGELNDTVENALAEVLSIQPVPEPEKSTKYESAGVKDKAESGARGAMIELNGEQITAVRTILKSPISVISGKPGSGKTSIVATVLRVIARIADPPLESIALAAPTGKAADRMRQSITDHLNSIPDKEEPDNRLLHECPPSTTVHRLLGYSPNQDRYFHNENNPLAEQLVIVDEASMVDLSMMDRILRALKPHARLVLLGDANQLPSVDTGAVLRDLCESKITRENGRAVVLERSYRAREENKSGKAILDVAAAINEGMLPTEVITRVNIGESIILSKQSEESVTKEAKSPSELSFAGVELFSSSESSPGYPHDTENVSIFFKRWLDYLCQTLPDFQSFLQYQYAADGHGFDEDSTAKLREIMGHYEKFRILCVTRVTAGGTGSEAINEWFRREWLHKMQQFDMGGRQNSQFAVGEPVIVTGNDYRLRLFNGDSGLVLPVKPHNSKDSDHIPMAVFGRGESFAAYPPEILRGRMESAWATTVHKAQGSEYDHVAVVLPGVKVRPLTRELLYTAVTRAKQSVTIVGSEEILKYGIEKKVERDSGLSQKLILCVSGGRFS